MKAGIIGGLGPQSTVDYYNRIITEYQKIKGIDDYPELIIESLNMTRILELINQENLDELAVQLLKSIKYLASSNAEVALIASNTPHMVFEKLNDNSPIPLISIVEETCKTCKNNNIHKVALLGTGFTMGSSFYQEVFSRAGIEIIIPERKEREHIHSTIFRELEHGIITENTKNSYLRIINRMVKEESIQGVILGCTELPLILKQDDSPVILFDTVEIHINRLIKELVK